MKRVGFAELIRGCPRRSVVRWLWYQAARFITWCWFRLFYRLRIEGREKLPLTGPVLLVCNHQSFLDPLLIGMATGPRPMHMLARRNLFKPFFMGWLLKSLNGIPVDRGTADIASMRRCIEIIKEGVGLSIFPEGTRTEDGRVLPFKSGMLLIARRSGAMIVPMAIAGSFEAWPRRRKLPHLTGRITVRFGDPVTGEQLQTAGDDARLLERFREQMQQMVDELEKNR